MSFGLNTTMPKAVLLQQLEGLSVGSRRKIYRKLAAMGTRRKIRILPFPEITTKELGKYLYGFYFLSRSTGMEFIVINQSKPLNQRIITLAHELGHLQLHRSHMLINKTHDALYWSDTEYYNRVEAQTDAFAFRLLSFVKSFCKIGMPAPEGVGILSERIKRNKQSKGVREILTPADG